MSWTCWCPGCATRSIGSAPTSSSTPSVEWVMSFGRVRQRLRGLSFRLNAWYAFVLVLVFALAAWTAHASAARSIERAQSVLVETEIAQHRARIEHAGVSG